MGRPARGALAIVSPVCALSLTFVRNGLIVTQTPSSSAKRRSVVVPEEGKEENTNFQDRIVCESSTADSGRHNQ
jgi:hypothetical protein